jgi:hypothetical protein
MGTREPKRIPQNRILQVVQIRSAGAVCRPEFSSGPTNFE